MKPVWQPSRDMRFEADGKHVISFEASCPIRLEYQYFTSDHRLTPNYHDYLEVFYVCEGRGRYLSDAGDTALHKDDMLVIGNRDLHAMEADPGIVLRNAVLWFMPSLVYRLGGDENDLDYLRPFYAHAKGFVRKIPGAVSRSVGAFAMLQRMAGELASRQAGYRLAVKAILLGLLTVIARHFAGKVEQLPANEAGTGNIERLRPVFVHISANYQERILLRQLAAIAHMSPSYLCRFFRQSTGRSLTIYINRLRIDRAKELLLATGWPVSRVAQDTGFDSHSYMDRMFRRLVGSSPQEFRMMHRSTRRKRTI